MNRIFVVFTALFIVCMCYVQPNRLKTIIYDESVYSDDVITLLQDGLYKVIAGLTTIEEVVKLVESDDELNAKTKLKQTLKQQEEKETQATNNTNT
jgi:hypothetical protein